MRGKTLRKPIYIVVAAVLAMAMAAGGAGAAFANTAAPSHATYPNGVRITTNAWITSLADSNSCGNYATSAVIGATPVWVKNTTSFHANGVGASVSGGFLERLWS